MGKTLLAFALVLSAQFTFAQSKLIEVDRVGNTRSVQYHYMEKAEEDKQEHGNPRRLTPDEWYSRILPIHTSTMTPGYVRPEEKELKTILRPVFIIGADNRSIEWLERNKQALVESNAVGILVEVQTIEQLKRIGKIASGLQVAPSGGEFISEILGIEHYPVLVSKSGIEQ